MSADEDVRWSWGRCKGAWGDVTVIRKCDSYQGDVKGVRKVARSVVRKM